MIASPLQRRLDASLARVSVGTPVAAGMTVEPGMPDCGVAERDGDHVTVRADWAETQDDDMLDFVIRHEACAHAVEIRTAVTRPTIH